MGHEVVDVSVASMHGQLGGIRQPFLHDFAVMADIIAEGPFVVDGEQIVGVAVLAKAYDGVGVGRVAVALVARIKIAAKGGGLDSVLLQMEKAKKLNVLDKSKMDWKEVKEGDAEMEEDLERHKKGKTYLEEQDFLKRAELREYEIERDARLAGDVRTRGRL